MSYFLFYFLGGKHPLRCRASQEFPLVQIAVLVMLILEVVTGQGVLGNWLKL